MKELKDKIQHRNKIIRIADSSSAGWNTVNEYEMIDYASDSDDDRKIRKAEERAVAKGGWGFGFATAPDSAPYAARGKFGPGCLGS